MSRRHPLNTVTTQSIQPRMNSLYVRVVHPVNYSKWQIPFKGQIFLATELLFSCWPLIFNHQVKINLPTRHCSLFVSLCYCWLRHSIPDWPFSPDPRHRSQEWLATAFFFSLKTNTWKTLGRVVKLWPATSISTTLEVSPFFLSGIALKLKFRLNSTDQCSTHMLKYKELLPSDWLVRYCQ